MRRVFEATRPDGQTIRRTSEHHVYSHAVAIWREARPAENGFRALPAQWLSAEWASRRALAEKNAARYNRQPERYRAVVLEAREVTKPTRDHLTIDNPTAPPFGNR